MRTESSEIEVIFQFGWNSIAIVMIDNISTDIAVIGCVLNNRKAVDVFRKPCELPGILGLGVFRNRPQLFQLHIRAVDGGRKAVQFVNTLLGGDLLEALDPFFTFDAMILP